MMQNALRFVLAQDVSVVIPGLKSTQEVEVAAKTGTEYTELTSNEAERFKVQFKDVSIENSLGHLSGFCGKLGMRDQ